MVLEPRHLERIRKKLLIKVEGETCVMEDMSKTGMRLIAPILFKKQSVNISFQMENIKVDLKGTIRWIQKKPAVYHQSQYLVGVLLTDPPPRYIELVEKLISETLI